MLTIYYNSSYWYRERVWLTRTFRYSKLYSLLQFCFYKLNIAMPNNLIFNGPQKLVNNYLKIFKKNKNVSFNDFKFENSYILQFDEFGEKILKKLKKRSDNSKIFVGPLFNQENLENLLSYKDKIQNLKIVVVSKSVKDNLLKNNEKLESKDILVLPVGIFDFENKLKAPIERTNECLIYFKKRKEEELLLIKNLLKQKNIKYKVFEYNNYKNKDLLNHANNSQFGIVLNKTESQGIAIQEMLGCNLPLLVCDYSENNVWGKKYVGTSVPYWSEDCGIKINNLNDLDSSIDKLLEKIENFSPQNYILENLSFEKCRKNLIDYINEK